MKHRLTMLLVFLICPYVLAQTPPRASIQGDCTQGGQSVTTSGMNSTTKVQRSYPACKVTAYITGSSGVASGHYTSGGTITGNVGQTCNLAFTGGGGLGATASVALTSTDTIAAGTVLTILTHGNGFTSAPIAATLTSGTATCSGTAVVTSTIGPVKATLYSDDAGTGVSNPITSDATGHWQFWTDPGRYDVTLSGTGITAAFTRYAIPNIDERRLFVDVTDSKYGAKGNGSTDDLAAFNAAAAYAATIHGTVFIPPNPGTYYRLSGTWIIPGLINIVGNNATLQWDSAATVGIEYTYDFVTATDWDEQTRTIENLYLKIQNKNAILFWCPYGLKSHTLRNVRFEGTWAAADAAGYTGVGTQIDGMDPSGRANWTSDHLRFESCKWQGFDTDVNLNGTYLGVGGIDDFVDTQSFVNCVFSTFRWGIKLIYSHGVLLDHCIINPSSFGYYPITQTNGGFRIYTVEGAANTIKDCYIENAGGDNDYSKIYINSGYSASYTYAPFTLINNAGLNYEELHDATLPLAPIYDPLMPQTGHQPGRMNRLYRVNMIDYYGSVINSTLESQNIVAGSNRGMVLMTPIADNVNTTAGITLNWIPADNTQIGTADIHTTEWCFRGTDANYQFISFRRQNVGAGGTPSWAHSGVFPTYGTEFFRIWGNGDIDVARDALVTRYVVAGNVSTGIGARMSNAEPQLYLTYNGSHVGIFDVDSTGTMDIATTNGLTLGGAAGGGKGNGTINATGFYAAGTAGKSTTVVVKGSAGTDCNLVFTNGLLTSTTCP